MFKIGNRMKRLPQNIEQNNKKKDKLNNKRVSFSMIENCNRKKRHSVGHIARFSDQ
jgi:hypothetical protein